MRRTAAVAVAVLAGCSGEPLVQPEEQFVVPLARSDNPMRVVGEAHNKQLHANMLRVRGMERAEMVVYLRELEAQRPPEVAPDVGVDALRLLSELSEPIQNVEQAVGRAKSIQARAMKLPAYDKTVVLAAASVLENSATYWDAMLFGNRPDGIMLTDNPFCQGDTGVMGEAFCKLSSSFGSIAGADLAGGIAGAFACKWTGGTTINCAIGGAVIGSTTEAVTRLLK